MDKNSLIIEIKNDLNSIKKQVEVALAKLAVLESMIELDKKLGDTTEECRDNACIVRDAEPESIAVSVAEPVEAPVTEPIEECRGNACIVRESEPEPIAEPIETPIAEPVSVAEPVEAPVEEPIEESRDNACIVRNLMSVISLGDKFRFRHDLFSDDNDLFKETIEILNTLENFEKAVDFLDEKFGWDPENATVVYFYDIIKPKF
jgi:hypothetical protein